MSEIHASEIWSKTHCLDKEGNVNDLIKNKIKSIGYTEENDTNRVFVNKQGHRLVVCLVDDFRSCTNEYHKDTPYLFDKNTTVITDNYLTCPAPYQLYRLPKSFFSIYNYVPENQIWAPDRDFSFSVNRIDNMRFHLMLELGWRVHLHKGYVNFNCEMRHADGTGPIERSVSTFNAMWEQFGTDLKKFYEGSYQILEPQMPIKNYTISHEEMHVSSYLNIIVETYHGDNNIALSEKIFRALVTPVPWTVFAGRYTVAYLESLGFDCLSDLINHNHYDRLKNVENKVNIFIWQSLQAIKFFKTSNIDELKLRCWKAAKHNQALLQSWEEKWPEDCNQWIAQFNTLF